MKHALLTALGALIATPALAAPGIDGSWTNPAHSVTIKIGPCGGEACGRVTAASPPARSDAARAGTSPLVGVELISAIEPTGPGRWRADIFVPDQNIHSTGDITLTGPNSMSVRGCVIGGLICKEQAWTRLATAKRGKR